MLFGWIRRRRLRNRMFGNMLRRHLRLQAQLTRMEARLDALEGMAHVHVPGGLLSLRRVGAEDCEDGGWWLRRGEETYADQDG